MTAAQGISLKIIVDVGTSSRVELQDAESKTLLVKTSSVSMIDLAALRDKMRRGLEQLREVFGRIESVDDRVAWEALERFHFAGRYILRLLFEEDFKELDRAAKICRDACIDQEKFKNIPLPWDRNAWVPSLVEIETDPDNGIAPELLPILNPNKPSFEPGIAGLGRMAGDFPGFAAVAHRASPTEPKVELSNDPNLPVRLYRHTSLDAAKSMPGFFRADGLFELEQDWPDAPDTPDDAGRLADLLWHHHSNSDGTARKQPIQIHHIACHCDTPPLPSSSALRFKRSWKKEKRIAADDLDAALGDLRKASWDAEDAAARPFVFLNACASAGSNPGALTSFPTLFAKGFRGSIGTQCVVPDWFATTFSKIFYKRLLSGSDVGLALYEAKWLMMKSKNPLGLIYCLYAAPNIGVKKKVPLSRFSKSTTVEPIAQFL